MAPAADDLKLPKLAVTVDLLLEGCPVRPVEVFVAEHQEKAFRRQYVLDLLEGAPSFLPARDVGEGRASVFNKASVVWVGIPLDAGQLPVEESPEAPETELYDLRREVKIELRGAEDLAGAVLYSLPDDQARITDYLNQPGRFVRLWTQERLYLVNKAYVLRVVETDHPDAPSPAES